MRGVVVSLPNDEGLARELGKKGTTNGISFYNKKVNGIAITTLFPSNLTEKFYAVAQSILLANVVVLGSKNLDALFGESVIASSLLGKKVLITADSDASSILNGLPLDYKIVEKEKLEEEILACTPKAESSEVRIDLDRAFPVNGVGDVVLGIVTRGSVSKHATLVHSSGKEALVRSVQMQDEDVEQAEQGARVGLALKGLSYKEVEKGDILASRQIKYKKEFSAKIEFSKFAGQSQNVRCLLVHNFSESIAMLTQKQQGTFSISLEKPMAIDSGDKFLLVRDSKPRIFASGTFLAEE